MAKKLSVVLATFNEEKNIERCLNSVKDIADEIIIVDGSSADKTVEIAKKFGAKIKITTNKLNFHINKQMAIDSATCEWILQLDADEALSSNLALEIAEKLKDSKLKNNGYWMPRKNWFLGRFLLKGGQYPDYTLRLYRRGKGRLPQKDVHEQAEVVGKTAYLKEPILHYPYRNFSHYIKKWDSYNLFYSEIIRKEEAKKNIFGKFFSGLNYLLIKPMYWFFLTSFRHKGIFDSWQGIVFSFFSALRFPASYIKYIGFYNFALILLLILGTIFRFLNFEGRVGIGGDAGRDAMIALEAIKRRELPLIGSFSSAGPFVFGPLFYWFIMFSYIVSLGYPYAPWIATSIVSVLTIIVFYKIGQVLGGNRLGFIASLLATFSPQLITRSLMLGQHSFIAFFSALLVLFFLMLSKTKKIKYAFLMGISLGSAISFHYQSINLILFIPAIFFLQLSLLNKLKALFLFFAGILIPSFPLMYWDSQQNFANINNLLDYLLIAQYRIYVPNSWKLFLFRDFPSYWSFVVGGYKPTAFILFIASFLYFSLTFIRRKLTRTHLLIGLIFSLLFILNRYYHGERSEGYMLYFIPFILIFSSLVINSLLMKKYTVPIAIGLTLLILIGNFLIVSPNFSMNKYSYSPEKFYKELSNKYPNEKFHFYDYRYYLYNHSVALSFYLNSIGKIDEKGMPIGAGYYDNKCCLKKFKLITAYSTTPIYDLRGPNFKKAKKGTWIGVNQKDLYDDLMAWQKGRKLQSTFSFKNYIIDKLKI